MTEEHIYKWLVRNTHNLRDEDLDHLTMMLHHLWLWFKEDYPVGDFLQAVIANDFEGAVVRADDINRSNLIVYIWFTHNELPWNWREIKKRQIKKQQREVAKKVRV